MELGSEFNLKLEDIVEKSDNIYKYLADYDTMYFNSGRSGFMALDAILPKGKVLVPGYLCDCVIESFKNHDVEFIKVNECLEYDVEEFFNKLDYDVVAVVLMNYFGHLQDPDLIKQIEKWKETYDFIVIEDTTHSIFSNPLTIGDYGICSLRKWLPIPDGGVLYSKKSLDDIRSNDYNRNENINKAYGMILKTLYLENGFDFNKEYRNIFAKSEERLDFQEMPLLISSFSQYLMRCIDIKDMVLKRQENGKYIYSSLKKSGNMDFVVNFKRDECPLTVPIYIENRNVFRKYLIDNNIFCAVHWPIENTVLGENRWAVNISDSIISLPIDQRYDKKDLDYMLDIIKKYFSEEC